MSKQIKMCCITTISTTTEIFVVEAMRQFVEKGYEVTLVCSMSQSFIDKYSDTFKCVNVPMQRGISILDAIKMPFFFMDLFKKEKYDYIQYATPNASLYASLGSWLARTPIRVYCQWGIRYVGSHGIIRIFLKLMERITCMFSTHIRPASQKNLEFAVNEGLYKRDKADVIGNGGTIGVDLMKFDISRKEEYRKEIYKQFPKLKDKIVFVFVGRPNDHKGCRELVEAFVRIANERKDVMLLMVCSSDDEMPVYIKKIEQRKDVVFSGFTREVYKYLSVADVHVHPSYREGFSMVIQESMAMGLPVITTDIPGPSEVIEEGVTGILVKPQSVESLYQGMKQMISNPHNMKIMGLAGRRRCEKYFSRKRMLQLTFNDRFKILSDNGLR